MGTSKLTPTEQHKLLLRVLDSGLITDWRCAIDGGAHVGDWTATLAERFEVVHAFEPDPVTFATLRERTRAQLNVIPYNAALFSHGCCMDLVWPKKREGRSRARRVRVAEDGSTAAVAIDDLCLDRCGLIKLDLEGCEFYAVKGAEETINRCRPVLIIEINAYGVYVGAKQEWLEKAIADLGYKEVMASIPDRVYAPC